MLNLDISTLGRQAAAAFRRFPLALLCAFAAFGMALCLVWDVLPKGFYTEMIAQLMFATALGIAVFTATHLYAETHPKRRVAAFGAGVAAFAGLAMLTYPWRTAALVVAEWWGIRFLLLGVVVHAAVALAPFAGRGSEAGFWQFNKALFLRLFTTGLYTGVLVAGLLAAIGAVQFLLGMAIREELYGSVTLGVLLLFNTWFFLGGVPADMEALEHNTDYPKGLKAFTQFALLPLVLLYLLILYLFMAKTVVTGQWPQGYVTWLVMSFAVVGLLAFLLVWPLRHTPGGGWVNTFAYYFYWALLPLVAFEALALGRRVAQYGLTEERVLGLALTFWLGYVVVAGLVQRGRALRLIPASLAVVLLLITVGPAHAAYWSIRSQRARFAGWLAERHLTPHPAKAPKRLTEAELEDFNSMAAFLLAHQSLQTAGDQSWQALTGRLTLAQLAATRPGIAQYNGDEVSPYTPTDSMAAAYGLVLMAEPDKLNLPTAQLPETRMAVPVTGFRFAIAKVHNAGNMHDTLYLGTELAVLTADSFAITYTSGNRSATLKLDDLERRVERLSGLKAPNRTIPLGDSALAAIFLHDYTKYKSAAPYINFTLLVR